MLICTRCTYEIPDASEKCPTCGLYAGPPNVRMAETREQIEALDGRYAKALEKSRDEGRNAALTSFDKNAKKTCAVVNVDLDFLYQFITNDKLIYTNYSLGVEAEARRPADARDDRDRETIGAMLFGHYAKEIRYAALSLDAVGPKSYGSYSMRLKEITIGDRATLLENNSYAFIAKHKVQPRQDIPPGYMAPWKERNKLAVAKLSERITQKTAEDEHAGILLFSEGDRSTDEFIEILIYGGFDNKAVESVKGKSSSARSKVELAMLNEVKDYLALAGKDWVEG